MGDNLNAPAKWRPGNEGCATPYDLGHQHGFEDRAEGRTLRPNCSMTRDQLREYEDGYRDAHYY